MTQQLTAEAIIALGASAQPPAILARRPVLSLQWTVDPNTGRATSQWVTTPPGSIS